jgi:hypothetical protein
MTQSSTETVIAPPVRERGYAHQQGGDFWGVLQTEKTPELRWPMCLEIFEDMNDQDGQVGSTFDAIVTPILSAKRRLDPADARDEVVEHIANDLDIPIVGTASDEDDDDPERQAALRRERHLRRRGRFSLREHHQIAVPDRLQYGHAVFEQVYFPPDDAGRLHLRKLGYRPPRTIAQWNIARDGGLNSVTQYAPGYLAPGLGVWSVGPTGVTLPVSRLVVYVNGRKGSRWIGHSIFRRAYKNWLLKDRLLRRYDQVTDRNGMGIPKFTAAGTGTDEVEAGLEIAEALRAGDDSGISLANGQELELMGVSGTLVDILAGIKYHDEQISRSMLANVLNLGQNRGTGSWSLGTTLQDILTLAIEAHTADVNDVDNKHIVEDLVEVNWGPDEPAPRIVVDEIGSRNDAIVNAIAQLVNAGVLGADEDLETFVRTTLGLPPRGGAPILKPANTGGNE